MERVVRERMTTEDVDTITPQTIINIRPVVAALKEFFGSSQLSQFMDQTNSLAGLTHRRRLSALGAGGLTRERAPIEVRDVHPTHYGRMCPIETPEGPNIGLIGSLASFATVSEFGFIQTPYRKVVERQGDRRDHLPRRRRGGAVHDRAGVASRSTTRPASSCTTRCCAAPARARRSPPQPKDVEYMDVAPAQIVSVATALIPFLEHNDANRALMGANMQRQAVPLMITQAPLVGTGLEYRAAVDTGDVVLSPTSAGTVVDVDAEKIVVETKDGKDEYPLTKFMRSNQGTLIHQKPIVGLGEQGQGRAGAGRRQLDRHGRARARREPARRVHAVRGLQLRGRDRASRSGWSRRTCSPRSTSTSTRSTPARRSSATRRSRATSRTARRSRCSDLDERGIVRIGAEVGSGDLLVGKVTPKGETELTAEEKLIRAIFKEKAREVRDTSLKVPHGEGGKVIDVKTFSRDAGDDLSPGVNELVRVYVAKKRKIAEGDKLAGRHGNKGVIAKIVPEEDMPFLEDGRARRRRPQPARRAEPDEHRPDPRDAPRVGGRARRLRRERRERHGVAGRSRPACAPRSRRRSSTARPRRTSTRRSSSGRGRTRTRRSSSCVDPKRPEGRRCSGKVRLFNGRTGEPFEQKVTVGYMYILKLLHLVDDKIHARSTGPYSLVTQQPLGGKAQFGGQRFGEMEVWALEAYGAAYTLQEMLTIKSDDTVGRVKAYEAIVKGENIAEPSIPESFKVLLKEMQSLALDVQRALRRGRRGRGARGGRRAAPRRGGARHRPLARLAARGGARSRPPRRSRRARSASTRTGELTAAGGRGARRPGRRRGDAGRARQGRGRSAGRAARDDELADVELDE